MNAHANLHKNLGSALLVYSLVTDNLYGKDHIHKRLTELRLQTTDFLLKLALTCKSLGHNTPVGSQLLYLHGLLVGLSVNDQAKIDEYYQQSSIAESIAVLNLCLLDCIESIDNCLLDRQDRNLLRELMDLLTALNRLKNG